MTAQRHVPLEGATNFRDFGGYATAEGTVRTGRLYRSDRLSELTSNDFQRLSDLGLQLVIDLRRSSEVATHPTQWQGTATPELWHAPLFEDDSFQNTLFTLLEENPDARNDPALTTLHMQNTYRRMLNEPTAQRQIARIFERLSSGACPTMLVHCSGGKDRTGVIAALIQLLLGVSLNDVMDDFMLTTRYYDAEALLHERAQQVLETTEIDMSREALLPVFTVLPDYLTAALDELHTLAPDVESYLNDVVGVPRGALAQLRADLVEF